MTPKLWIMLWIAVIFSAGGCSNTPPAPNTGQTVTDQLGRKVELPVKIEKIAALHHFGGKIVYALGLKHMLVERSIYGKEANALERVDPSFAALPKMIQSHGYHVEGLASLAPDLVFSYASNDRSELAVFEAAGIPVVGVKGETFGESFEAVRLMADILGVPQKGARYITTCRNLLDTVEKRLNQAGRPPRTVLFSGPKNIYSAATGQMLQTRILECAGARNVAERLKGFWADVSPEQIALWNPDVIFLGSSLDTYGLETLMDNPHFRTVKAVRTGQVFVFPSNVGWWDYPAPHCVLGVVWSAKTLFPDLFADIDIQALADEFYREFIGFSFTRLGGRLKP